MPEVSKIHSDVGRSDRNPFVAVAGRLPIFDVIKQAMRRSAPPLVVKVVQRLLYPYVVLRLYVGHWYAIRKALPAPARQSFNRLYNEARLRWANGQLEPTGASIDLPLRDSPYVVSVRPGTCDVITYYETVVREQYGHLLGSRVRTIVDCGANIGLVSAYLLSRYPDAQAIAFEPDAINFALCERNLAQFRGRVVLVRAAICGQSGPVSITGHFGGTWASTVVPALGNEPDVVEGITLPELFSRYNIGDLDVLKIDIEGAELEVFQSSDLSWLDRVGCIQVELESDLSKQAFFAALAGRPFRLAQCRDVVVALRDGDDASPQTHGPR